MDISNAWGYGGVIIPDRLLWQGFIILDPAVHEMQKVMGQTLAKAYQVLERFPGQRLAVEGMLSAVVVDMFVSGNEAGVRDASSALSAFLEKRFWIVTATIEEAGTSTKIDALDVETPEAVRDEINRRAAPLKLAHLMRLSR